MEQFSQDTYKSLQKILYNQSCKKDLHVMGRMKGKEKRRCGEGTCMPGRSYDRWKATSPWEPLSLARRSAWTDRKLQRLERKVCKLARGPTRPREASADRPGHITVLPSPSCVPVGVHSDWLQQTGLERQLGLTVQRQPKGSFWPQKERVTIVIMRRFLYALYRKP